MKKFFLSLVIMIMATAAVKSQTLVDSATLRAYINSNIVTNGSKQITAAQLNRILVGYLNIWPRYSIDSLRESGDSIYARKNRTWSFVFKLGAGGGGAPGGGGNQFQYNDEGAFAGATDFVRGAAGSMNHYGFGYVSPDSAEGYKLNVKASHVVDGSDEITNGTFTGNADDWTLDAMEWSGGKIQNTGADPGGAFQAGSLIEGDYYTITADITGTTGTVTLAPGLLAAQTFDAGAGSVSFTGRWYASMFAVKAYIQTSEEFDGTVDNITVRHTLIQGGLRVQGESEFIDGATFANQAVRLKPDSAVFNNNNFYVGQSIRFNTLSGNGDGFIAVDNDGDLSWSAAPTGSIYTDDGTIPVIRTVAIDDATGELRITYGTSGIIRIYPPGDFITMNSDGGGNVSLQGSAAQLQAGAGGLAKLISPTGANIYSPHSRIGATGAPSTNLFEVTDGVVSYIEVDSTNGMRTVKVGAMGAFNTYIKVDDNNNNIELRATGQTYNQGKFISDGVIGYSNTAGASTSQSTNKSTGVTQNKVCGQITTNSASLAANTSVGFTVTNSVVTANDVIVVNMKSGGSTDSYVIWVDAVGSGTFRIMIRNTTAGALAESLVLQYAVLRGDN